MKICPKNQAIIEELKKSLKGAEDRGLNEYATLIELEMKCIKEGAVNERAALKEQIENLDEVTGIEKGEVWIDKKEVLALLEDK